MAEQQTTPTENIQAQPQAQADFSLEALNSVKDSFEKNKTIILGVLGAVFGLSLLAYLYFGVYKKNQAFAAGEAMFQAQFYFEQDSFNTALLGAPAAAGQEEIMGFAAIIDNYSGTPSGNLAQYYAGICYLNLGKFQEAIDHLSQYSGQDALTQSMAYGAIGDAYSEMDKFDDAMSFYQKAANYQPNPATAPYFLRKAGLLNENLKKPEEAKKLYEQIIKDFPSAAERTGVQKDLIRVSGTY